MSHSSRGDVPKAGTGSRLPIGRGSMDDGVEARHERRVLTALCYDLVGSTELLGLLGIEDFEELILAFQTAAKGAIVSCSGTVMVEAGDGGLAVFPVDLGAKDAASLTISAGLAIVRACKLLAAEKRRSDLHVRVGVATSMTLILKGDTAAAQDTITGPAFALATRLQAIARPDTVFVCNETRNLTRRSHVFSFCGSHVIKGFAQPEQVWQALSHKRGVDRFFAFGRLTSPLIDRTDEAELIHECWNESVSGRGQVIVIEGEAGIGKSRILHEVRRRTRFQRNRLLLFQCVPGDSRSTLHPLRQAMLGNFDDGERTLTPALVAEVFAAHDVHDTKVVDIFSFLLGVEGARSGFQEMDPEVIREKADWAARHALQATCASGPVILIVEDIHWIDLTSKQLLRELAKLVPSFPVLLIATTRPGFGDWLDEKSKRVLLPPLEHADTLRAIATMWPQGKRAPAPELMELVERVTGGVPLFIEEVCQWMAENAASGREQLPQGVSLGRAAVLETVLDARLEPLGCAREVARAAAVAGSRFSPDLLSALLPEFDPGTISAALDALAEAGLVRARHAVASVYAFRHTLIQETIYNGILRKRRQTLHQRLYAVASGNRSFVGWLTTAALADHAERGGLLDEAIGEFINAGMESSSRSAMAEARHLLEHAIALCGQVSDHDKRDALRLSAMVALGPILTAVEGPNSEHARTLYDDGVKIARRRPIAERAKWFPIYWGWWFTGSVVDGERAQAVVSDLKEVSDPEIQLQARHCLWAVDFNRGDHGGCIAAIDAGLPLYEVGQGHANATRFGGHDARVCGFAHRALSLWFSGRATSALRSMSEARRWAQQTGHVSSIAHACINDAMLSCYRRDFASLRDVIEDLRQLTALHHLPSLVVSAQIFEGWCDGNAGQLERGKDKMREGLGLHGQVQTPEDEPVYCAMLAELLARSGEISHALALLHSAVAQAEAGGSRYWLAELHRRIAQLLVLDRAAAGRVATALEKSLNTAAEQNAVPILIAAYETLSATNLAPVLLRSFNDRVEAARKSVEPGEPLIVNPEPELRASR
ncbi:MAG: adenylate/guanylate cyclase domain-containing protein [Mesorhizobium sp.]|nr:adenylate/guanylate cyclase domain-containing protein [Mesorhizobium sp. M00.F.Ca.ET.217.01.1.1]TGV92971.1 adenylate/guanylate cyclase domain-containing protein [Mesorhizobium sp. M00.F.Ca.ET.158.01.1.1]TKB44739.1 MAG: adenylate/guanylate cyclase domain-containing protein [Mesorhizobium sp.]